MTLTAKSGNVIHGGTQNEALAVATNDFVFKKVFAENTDLLASLLVATLDVPESEMESLDVMDAHLCRKNIDDKDGILDIKVKTKTCILDVEIQVRNQPSLFKREQFYLASLYVEQIKSGDKYGALNKAIGILITAFSCFEDAYWCHRFRYYDKAHDVTLPDSCEMVILELPKVGAEAGVLADWLRFVKAKNREDFMQAAVHNPLINKAVGIITALSEDDEVRLLAESREKALRDMWDREDGARAEKTVEIARNFLMAGIDRDVVAQNTGLSREDVEAIVKRIGQ